MKGTRLARRIPEVLLGVWLLAAGCGSSGTVVYADLGPDVGKGDLAGEEAGVPDLPPDAGRDLSFEANAPETQVETIAGQGEIGWPCDSGVDCYSGICLDTPDGKQCTQVCDEECPEGWECALYPPSLPDQVHVCAVPFLDLCRPCRANADCRANDVDLGQACISYGPAGAFCGAACSADKACPAGYECQEREDVTGTKSSQCIFVQGTCPCTKLAVDAMASTDCYQENDWGKCAGDRACQAGGLSGCSAASPKQETCNAEDDDCDGQADEGPWGQGCLVTNLHGSCPGAEDCQGGMIVCLGKEAGPEQCDGIDNDCDGTADEGFSDTDQDGVADCLENDKDGDGIPDGLDNCPTEFNPLQLDYDSDNFGDACDKDDDNDLTPDEKDCAPLDNSIHPGAVETCNGKDDDCNLIVDEGFADTDFDGWKDCVDDDDDADGTPDDADCAPLDNSVHPGAVEICNGKDDDCDGTVDEGSKDTDKDGVADCADPDDDNDGVSDPEDNCPLVADLSFADMDMDGLGDACDPDLDGDSIPNGTDNCPKAKNTPQADTDKDGQGDDCDADDDGDGVPDEGDNCPLVENPSQADSDKDGVGDACEDDKDGDGTPDAQDCAPLAPAVHPGAPELCDGLDNDCDLLQDEGFPDLDKDGLKDCVDPDDDDDGEPDDSDCAPLDPTVHHLAVEVCDGVDNDCSGSADDNLGMLACGKGECFHSLSACIGGIKQTCDPFQGAVAEKCDGKDNDCDGLLDEDLGWLFCGVGQCQHATYACKGGEKAECNPMEGASAEECDGKDNDCDGQVDDGLGMLECGQGACKHSAPACAGGVLQQCNPLAGATPETCNGKDDDCDGQTDEDLGTTVCGMGACFHEVPVCLGGKLVVCNPMEGAGPETCNGADDDCDGQKDEELGLLTCGKGSCLHSVPACTGGKPGVCDPMEGAKDESCNGADDDCDGQTDEELGKTTCGLGVCEHTVDNCVGGKPVACNPLAGALPEKCNDKDDDCNGKVDDAPSDCIVWYGDGDKDGSGGGNGVCLCKPDPAYPFAVADDCNDADPAIHPAALENCTNNKDDNCDGKIDAAQTPWCTLQGKLPIAATIKVTNDGGSPLSNYAVPVDVSTLQTDFTGLFFSLHFNEGSGNRADDSSGYGMRRAGSFAGQAGWDTGVEGKAISLPGGSTYYRTAIGDADLSQGFTYATWINVTNNENNHASFAYVTGNWMRLFVVTPNCCGSWYQGLEFCNNQGCLTPAGHPNSHPYLPQLKANEWVHIAMRFEGTSGKAYWFIDGEQAAEFSGVSFPAFTGKDLYNGGDQDNGDSYNFTGRIDEAFWFARVLKPAEILGLYCHGARNLGQVPGKCSGVAEKGRYDHADIAVFSADGGSQLPTWVENDRRLWVRIPNQAAGKTVSYPVLFGSKDAYGGTDPNGVFLLYDGFSATDDAAPDAARWTANSGSGYAKTFERMICTRSNGGKSDDTTAAFLASKSTFAGGVAVEADLVTYSASINTFWSVLMEDAAQTSFYPTGKHVRTRDGTAPAEAGFRIVVDGQQAVSEAGIGVTRRLLTAWTGKDVTVRLDDVQKHLGPWSAAGPVRFVVGVRGGGTPGEYAEGCFDRLLARPYVSPEPTAVVVP